MVNAAGDIFKLAIVGDYLASVQVVNTFYFRTIATDLLEVSGPVELALEFETQCKATWRAANYTASRWVQSEITKLYPTPEPVVLVPVGTPNAGTQASWNGFTPPAMLAQHAILRTAASGRRNRGRLYLGPPGYTGTGPGGDGLLWPTNNVAAFQSFLQSIHANFVESGVANRWEWGVFSYVGSGPADPTHPRRGPWTAPHFSPILAPVALAGIRTQKRREAARGV